MNLFALDAWLWALASLPLIALVIAWFDARRRKRLSRLIARSLQPAQVRALTRGARTRRTYLLLAGLACVVAALARPLGGETTQPFTRSGRDVVFVVDVSRSMLAQDLAPTRLDRAKQIVSDGLSAMRGDRVALVAFAGTAVVKCPLTTDTSFARLVLDELDSDSVSRGGSYVGDALRRAIDSLFPDEDDGRIRDVVLISDGEDHGSFPVDAAAALQEHKARLITIGLGRESGAEVPGPNGRPLMYEGERVVSKQDSAALEQMALATEGGVYLPVGDGYIEFDKVYRGLARDTATSDDVKESTRRAELFQWPLALAFALFSLERMLRERR